MGHRVCFRATYGYSATGQCSNGDRPVISKDRADT